MILIPLPFRTRSHLLRRPGNRHLPILHHNSDRLKKRGLELIADSTSELLTDRYVDRMKMDILHLPKRGDIAKDRNL